MYKIKNRNLVITLAFLLILSMSASMIQLPTTSAHAPAWQVPTFAYIQAVPNPIGVGQTATIYMWLANTYADALKTNDYRFHNYKLTITAPDGTVTSQTFTNIMDSTSNQFYSFTPTQVGTYRLNFTYPGQNVTDYSHLATSAYLNDAYLPSTSSTTLTVQEASIATYDLLPLPTEYWTRPIYGENVYWYSVSSNWLGTGSAGYGTGAAGCNVPPGNAIGPETSHVMWTYPLDFGGIVGGTIPEAGSTNFEGSAYNGRFTNTIIMNGFMYYTKPVTFTGMTSGETVCQDLRTGKIIWSSPVIPAPSFGYIYDVDNPNQHGTYPPILFTSNFAQAYDAYTGCPLFNVTAVPTGTQVVGPAGEQLRLILTNLGNTTNPIMYLSQWNSSRLWENIANPWTGAVVNSPVLYNYSTSTGSALTTTQAMYAQVTQPAIGAVAGNDPKQPATRNYVIYGNVVNFSSTLCTYDWNVSLDWLNTITPAPTIVAAWAGDMMIARSGSTSSNTVQTPYTYFGINLNVSKGAVGSKLWSNTLQPPAGNITVSYSGPANSDPTQGVFVEFYKESMQFVGYSMSTGQKLWGPIGDQSQNQLMYYNSGYNSGGNENGAAYAYGRLYYDGFGGIMSCYDLQTGNLLWTYGNGGSGNSTQSGFEVPGPYPMTIYAIGNGIVYTTTTEHTVQIPLYRGATQQAINATTGELIWALNDVTSEAGGPGAALDTGYIADGFSVTLNGYDNQIYCVGKGPSSTTVAAPNLAAAFGQSVVISGTVMDLSSGTTQDEQTARFNNGVPVSSDASMSDWMGYVYQQKPLPTNFTGVEVTINVVDSNGNYRTIGTTTTDAKGFYTLKWTPDITGEFKVVAVFAGNKGYWSSSAEAAFAVDEPIATATPQATAAPSMADLYFMPMSIALFVAIVVIGTILALLLLRKHP
jgi:hypothetical protein